MPGYYDLWTVSLSYAIAALSGFAAFESVRHARHSGRRLLWATISGVVLGFGIWSMHFVGMLAWVPPFPLFYSVNKTVASMVAAVLASLLAMHLAVAPALPSRFRLTLGATFVATGICAMHYIGMSAVHFSTPEMWSVPWVAASCVIALVASFAALLLLNRSNREGFNIGHQISGALAIGLAICGMHYSGMHAMMLHPGSVSLQYSGDASGATLARIGVGNALIFTFCLLVISYQDRLRLLHAAHDAQLEAQDASRTAEQLSAAGRIAASIAHEVNNPLEAVTNLLYLAEHSDISPTALAYLHQAQSELQRVSEITTHTLKFYRQQHAASSASLPELVDSVLVLFGGKLEIQHISVQKDWQPEVPKVHCRAGEIRQVIANLVGNAIDSMPLGGTLSVSMHVVRDSIELAIMDTGQGISEEVKEKLFQPFFTTKGVGGTGLGLSISAEILERHGGTLMFESKTEPPDQGTTFKMVLPREERDSRPRSG
ncbi:signal transduction histidine kinase [Silvibacterium bohemicum]|uniref:histidine kinase n=1 Tax=Silvibacterium bohemicum TaxID=1577686 RepID=A0A841JPB0_9BACT|nr:MHYT domain-containing protein [Silvibacterium bohemicum]MBB6143186.1 signal transduction histidine kinase [Silvibacterium bohemicum]